MSQVIGQAGQDTGHTFHISDTEIRQQHAADTQTHTQASIKSTSITVIAFHTDPGLLLLPL